MIFDKILMASHMNYVIFSKILIEGDGELVRLPNIKPLWVLSLAPKLSKNHH